MNIFLSLHKHERGSAMTEFVIGLPIFIMIFVGMGAIHRLHAEGIAAKLEVNKVMWEKANPGAPGALGMVPALGVVGISDWGDIATDGAGLLGIYADSYAKTLIPLTASGLVGSTRPSSPCATLGCGQIQLADNYFGRPLLDDNAISGATSGVSFDGWANAITSVLDIAGSRPAVAAGIRYGSVESPSVSRSVTLPGGTYSMETGELGLPGITDPTQRIFAVALTRLEFGTKDIWHSQIPEFNDEFTLDTGEAPSQSGECDEAVSNQEACLANPPTNPETGMPDASMCAESFDGEACAGENEVPGLAEISADFCTPGIPGCP